MIFLKKNHMKEKETEKEIKGDRARFIDMFMIKYNFLIIALNTLFMTINKVSSIYKKIVLNT